VLPIRFDHTHAMTPAVGEHGLSESELMALTEPSVRALESVQARRSKDLRWLDLPYRDAVRKAILDYAASVRGRFENVCVLGIGGSALGNTALHTALERAVPRPVPAEGQAAALRARQHRSGADRAFLERVDPTRTSST
jgi:glucose-6-phosphate isomerase